MCLQLPCFISIHANVTESRICSLVIVEPFPFSNQDGMKALCTTFFFPEDCFGKLNFFGNCHFSGTNSAICISHAEHACPIVVGMPAVTISSPDPFSCDMRAWFCMLKPYRKANGVFTT